MHTVQIMLFKAEWPLTEPHSGPAGTWGQRGWEATTGPEGTLVRGGNVFCVNGSSGDTVSTLGKFQPTVPDTLPRCPGPDPSLTPHACPQAEC